MFALQRRLAAWASLSFFALAAAAQMPPPLARLSNGEVIAEQDLSDYLDRRADLRSLSRNAWGTEEVVREMALTRALNLEGEVLNMPRRTAGEGPTPRFDDVYALAVQRRQSPACKPPASEQEARQYFNTHPQAFVVPVQVRVQRIMLPASTQIDGRQAMDWLLDRAQAISAGAGKFSDAAERAQQAYQMETQGDLGWVNLELDTNSSEILTALKGVKPGQMLGPVRDGEFAYLFLMTSRREPRALTWDEAKGFAATRAESHCRTQAATQLREDLFKKYGVQIDRAAIRELFTRTAPSTK